MSYDAEIGRQLLAKAAQAVENITSVRLKLDFQPDPIEIKDVTLVEGSDLCRILVKVEGGNDVWYVPLRAVSAVVLS